MPKGFNRIGNVDFREMGFGIYKTYDDFMVDYSNIEEKPKFCVPVWRYRSGDGHTFLRLYNPRVNVAEIVVVLEDCLDQFTCIEITEEDIKYMD
jgi:hypothetical protein